MTYERYNGWTNYETWRVNLEWFDGDDWERYDGWFDDWLEDGTQNPTQLRTLVYDLGECLLEEVEEAIGCWAPGTPCSSTFVGWLMAWLKDVNWTEIASHAASSMLEEELGQMEFWTIYKR